MFNRQNKEKKKLTPQQEKENELKMNIILILTLLTGFIIVIIIFGRFKAETESYDRTLVVEKNITDISGINDIKPLYTYDTKPEPTYNTVEIEDTNLYEEITDDVYLDYEKYGNIYNDNVLKEYNRKNIEYLKFEVTKGKLTKYYFIINNELYVNETGVVPSISENNEENKFEKLNNKYVQDIYDIVEKNTATSFNEYLKYMVDLNYYIILSNKQNAFCGYAILNDGNIYELSLINFIDIINKLEES